MVNNAAHVTIDEIADAAEDLLPDEQIAHVTGHLDACTECRELADALTQTCAALGEAPTPPMPDDVFARLQAVVDTESQRRACGAGQAENEAARTAAAKRTDLGTFGQNPAYGTKIVRPARTTFSE